jgi:hypothetical protein
MAGARQGCHARTGYFFLPQAMYSGHLRKKPIRGIALKKIGKPLSGHVFAYELFGNRMIKHYSWRSDRCIRSVVSKRFFGR